MPTFFPLACGIIEPEKSNKKEVYSMDKRVISILLALCLLLAALPAAVIAREPDENTEWKEADPVEVSTVEELIAAVPDGEKEPDENNIVWIPVAKLKNDITVDPAHEVRTLGSIIVPSGCTLTVEGGASLVAEVQIQAGGCVRVQDGGFLGTTMGGEDAIANAGTLEIDQGAVLQSQMGGNVVNRSGGTLILNGTFYCGCFQGTPWFRNAGDVVMDNDGIIFVYNVSPHRYASDMEAEAQKVRKAIGRETEEADHYPRVGKAMAASSFAELQAALPKNPDLDAVEINLMKDLDPDKARMVDSGEIVIPGDTALRGRNLTLAVSEGVTLTLEEGASFTGSLMNNGTVRARAGVFMGTTMGGFVVNNGEMIIDNGAEIRSQMGGDLVNRGRLTLNGDFYCGSVRYDGVDHLWADNTGTITGTGRVCLYGEDVGEGMPDLKTLAKETREGLRQLGAGQVTVGIVSGDPDNGLVADPDAKPASEVFEDISAAAYYSGSVTWAVSVGVTNGTSETTFGPEEPCTRGHIVTFLWRAKGSPEPKSTDCPFVDVTPGSFYYKAMLWAVENEITNGVDATHFAPDEPCNRAQAVTFLWRAEGAPAPKSASTVFTDVNPKGFYYKAMLWAGEKSITKVATETTFAPETTCTRGHIVTFLYRDLG